jgi:hypothetical protein
MKWHACHKLALTNMCSCSCSCSLCSLSALFWCITDRYIKDVELLDPSSSWLGFGMCLIVCLGYGNKVLEILVQSRWLWERRLWACLLVFLCDMELLLWACLLVFLCDMVLLLWTGLLLISEKLLWASMVRILKLTLHLADQVHKCALLFLCAIWYHKDGFSHKFVPITIATTTMSTWMINTLPLPCKLKFCSLC